MELDRAASPPASSSLTPSGSSSFLDLVYFSEEVLPWFSICSNLRLLQGTAAFSSPAAFWSFSSFFFFALCQSCDSELGPRRPRFAVSSADQLSSSARSSSSRATRPCHLSSVTLQLAGPAPLINRASYPPLCGRETICSSLISVYFLLCLESANTFLSDVHDTRIDSNVLQC